MRRRILRSTLLAVTVTAVALGAPLGYTAVQIVSDLTRQDLALRARQIAVELDNQIANDQPVDVHAVRVVLPEHGQVKVNIPAGSQQQYGPDPGINALVESAPMAKQGTVSVLIPAGPLRTSQLEVAGGVALLVVLSVGVGAVFATLTARRLAEPLQHVVGRAARLGAGDFRPDTRRYRIDELDKLAEALDASASALAQLLQRERELISDVSHQLRSRLTAIQLRLESLALHGDPSNTHDAQAALEQAEQLGVVLEELLAAARAARAAQAEPVDLSQELPLITQEWRNLLRQHGRAFRLRIPHALLAKVTPSRLREVIGVLLDNAVRHGAGGVHVVASQGDGMILIAVRDSGDGIPAGLAAHVFERGVSGKGSTGVGLALARALVEADGGRLELAEASSATFTIFLPVARAGDVTGAHWPATLGPR